MLTGFDRPLGDLATTASEVDSLIQGRNAAILDLARDMVCPGTAKLNEVVDKIGIQACEERPGFALAIGQLHAALASRSLEKVSSAAYVLSSIVTDLIECPATIDGCLRIWPRDTLSFLTGLQLPDCFDPVPDKALSSLREGFELLGQLWPEAPPWLRLAIRDIAVVDGRDDRLVSGSFDFFHGFLYLSYNSKPLRTAEMLLHEGAHKFFLLAEEVFPVVVDNSQLFYSPFVRKPRPLSKVMLGYHAFSNVKELYRREAATRNSANNSSPVTDEVYELSSVSDLIRQQLPIITSAGRSLIGSWL